MYFNIIANIFANAHLFHLISQKKVLITLAKFATNKI